MNNEMEMDNVNAFKGASAGQLDDYENKIRYAEGLLKDAEFARLMLVITNEITNTMKDIQGHTQEDNNRRIALANQLTGVYMLTDKLQTYINRKQSVVNARTKLHPTK